MTDLAGFWGFAQRTIPRRFSKERIRLLAFTTISRNDKRFEKLRFDNFKTKKYKQKYKERMKLKILILTTVILLTSCVSTKTYSGYVEKKLETKKNSADIHNESISFDLSQLELQNNTVESEKVKSFFIPAILYWGWENTIECKISPAIVGQTFKSSFLNCADSLGLFNKLNEQQIEISIEKIPTSFVYTNKGNTMIFIIAYTVSELEAIYPQEQNLVINYKLIKNGQTTKTGKLIATNKDKPIKNIWKSTKKFTWLYIDKFDNNIKVMTNDIVEQLLKQI